MILDNPEKQRRGQFVHSVPFASAAKGHILPRNGRLEQMETPGPESPKPFSTPLEVLRQHEVSPKDAFSGDDIW